MIKYNSLKHWFYPRFCCPLSFEKCLFITPTVHSIKYISVFFEIEWNMIVLKIFTSFLKPNGISFLSKACIRKPKQKEKYRRDHISLNFKENGNLVSARAFLRRKEVFSLQGGFLLYLRHRNNIFFFLFQVSTQQPLR